MMNGTARVRLSDVYKRQAYTYNEPLVGLEFVLDCAREARAAGLVNVLVSNGYVNPEPFSQLAPLIDAANIDLKGFTPEVYRELGGRLEPVKATIATLAALPSCHVELTTLIVPGLKMCIRDSRGASRLPQDRLYSIRAREGAQGCLARLLLARK